LSDFLLDLHQFLAHQDPGTFLSKESFSLGIKNKRLSGFSFFITSEGKPEYFLIFKILTFIYTIIRDFLQ